ncbi:MAG: sialate O-acetylesterase [Verrucomicrobiae bacterium]|nr:sialate O-acetylesterase [Verrucomicrobiae bacterium]NNJ42716.1 sialate O-acetylesterase [Akkermansiaceae bacterium]
MSKPVKVFILMGQSNMLGFGKTSGLKSATEKGQYPYLVDDSGDWIVRKDVRNVRVMCSGSNPWNTHFNDWLSGDNGSGATGGKFGPEIGIGHYVGHVLDEPVLILKACIGNRSLGYDLLPPSAPGYEGNKDDPTRTPKEGGWYAGVQYDGDTKAAKDVMKDIGTYYPGATKCEVAGFFFWQGAKDQGKSSKYEENLVHLIKDLRKDFNAPDAPFVCATMGHEKKGGQITDAQLAVDGKTGKYPEFKGNVATFYSNPVSKGGGANGHYGGNAETYMNIGDGMGKAMAELLQGN